MDAESGGNEGGKMSRRKAGVPVLLADAYLSSQKVYYMQAWCPMCAIHHNHGGIDSNSHRAAHCFEGPYKKTGYYLRLDIDKPENVKLQKKYKAGLL